MQERIYVKSCDSSSSGFKTSLKGYSDLVHLILSYDCYCLVYKQTSDVHVLGRNQ